MTGITLHATQVDMHQGACHIAVNNAYRPEEILNGIVIRGLYQHQAKAIGSITL